MNNTTTDQAFTTPPAPTNHRKLTRDPNKVLGGVCSGLAHHLGYDVIAVRLVFILLFLMLGTGPLFYILAWIIVPMSPHPLGRTEYLGGAAPAAA